MFVRYLKKVKVLFSDTYLLNRTILKIVARCKEITLTSYYKDQKLPPSFEEPIGMDEREIPSLFLLLTVLYFFD